MFVSGSIELFAAHAACLEDRASVLVKLVNGFAFGFCQATLACGIVVGRAGKRGRPLLWIHGRGFGVAKRSFLPAKIIGVGAGINSVDK